MCAVLLASGVSIIQPADTVGADTPTLGELLGRSGQDPAGLPGDLAEQQMTSFAVLDEPQLFALAGYVVDEGDSALGPLHVWRFDGHDAEWAHATIDLAPRGSVLALRPVGRFLLVRLHHSPSSSTDLVLTLDLRVHDHLEGAAVAVFDDRKVLVQRGQPHFAPIFETVLDLYDLEARQGLPIFPPVPASPFRRWLMETGSALYRSVGEDWCRRENRQCDPSKLDSVLDEPVVYDAQRDALAFSISYDTTPLDRSDSARRHVLYVYRHIRSGDMEYREVPAPGTDPPTEAQLNSTLSIRGLQALFGATSDP